MRPDSFTSPPKEAVLWMFITLKNPSLSARFEPVSFGSSGKHDNLYTAENEYLYALYVTMPFKIHGRMYVQFYAFLTLTLGGQKWPDSCSSCCTPREALLPTI
jgi:hypothetical protein